MKQKTVLTVWGSSNQGKTTTLMLVKDQLCTHLTHTLISHEKTHHDDRFIIQFGALKVGIETHGDIWHKVVNSLNRMVVDGCDLILCCSRPSGYARNHILDHMTNVQGYRTISWSNYASKQIPDTILNPYSANQFYDMVSDVMKGVI